jgi:probable phosphomutase (TIGR03848 family)
VATLVLLRHGRTAANASGVLAGNQPVELDDTGQIQARALAERLAASGVSPAYTLSSPLVRCRQTAEIALPDAKIIDEARLVECDYGEWSGQPLKKLAKDPLWRVVQGRPSAAVFPEGEAMAAMSARAIEAVREWDARAEAESGPDAVVVAVSHGDVIKAIVADAMGMHLDMFQRIAVDPASVTVIRYTPLRPFLIRLNDIGGDLSMLRPVKRRRRHAPNSDAVVGGGAGASAPAATPSASAPGGSAEAGQAAHGGTHGPDRIGSKA